MPKTLEGYVDDGRGAPLAGLPAVVTKVADGAVVTTGATGLDGRWAFAGLPVADEYIVTLTDPAGNAVARAPWSGELREVWVRDRLDVAGKPLVLDPAAGNALAWTATGLYVPPVPAQLDAWTKTQSDARYVDVTGDTMSGSLAVVNSTSTRISNVRAAGSLQRPGVDFERWKTTVGTIEEVTVGSTIGTFGFNASGAATLAYGGSIYAYVDAPIVGGTAPIAFSFYHATLGETYRLDSQGRGWFAPPEDTSTFPATPGLYISGKWVGLSPDAGNSLLWNANGFFAPAGLTQAAADARYVDVAGDTMTGDLLMGTTRKIKFFDEVKDDKLVLYGTQFTIGIRGGEMAYFVAPAGASHNFYINNVSRWLISDTLLTATATIYEEGAATSTIVHQAKLPADTQPRFTIRADGQLNWGGGGVTATDVSLYRVTANDTRISSTLSGSTNNTRALGFATVQWSQIHGVFARLSGDGSTTSVAGAAGALRLVNGAFGNIAWRNQGNTADLTLGVNASNALVASGDVVIGGNVGFYNTAAQAKPAITGSRAGNAALADLLTKLATLGLITNSSSA